MTIFFIKNWFDQTNNLDQTWAHLQELKYLVEDFKDLLTLASKNGCSLILLLDSLDQLDKKDGGRQLHWLPRKLPKNVKIILSTLPKEKYGCFLRLQVYQKYLKS